MAKAADYSYILAIETAQTCTQVHAGTTNPGILSGKGEKPG
jgi:hypothetical protein